MASPPPNPKEGEEGGSESTEETSGEREATPQKTFIAPPASQLPSKLQYVAVGTPGPSGIKQCYRTSKTARRVPTLPRRPRVDESGAGPSGVQAGPSSSGSGSAPEPERRARRDRGKRHVCAICEKRFSSPGKLSQHVLSHTGELPFSCDLCDKRFNSKFKLVRHSLIHSEERAFACNICGKTFNRKDHLTNHVRVHNPHKKLFTCERPDCKKSYTSLLSYRKHAALHAAEEGDLQCKMCDETFTSRQDIVYHLKVHTGSRTVKNETDKKFTCNSCGRKFFTAKDVRRHHVVHTGRRDFLCPFCPQKFGRKDHLVRHVKNAHPDKSWKSAAVGTSKEPPPTETSTFEETLSSYALEGPEFTIWQPGSPEEGVSKGGRTRVPSSEIIVEMPSDMSVKEEVEIKMEEPTSPSTQIAVDYPPVVFVVPPYTQSPTELPYTITSPPLGSDPLETHLLDPVNVMLMDPGEGPSGILGLLESEPAYAGEEGEPTYTGEEEQARRGQQRLPAFTQAFQTAQSPKPPPPPPPPH